MKKRLRSRVLAAGMVSSTLLGSAGLLCTQSELLAQDKPSAASLLDRGSKLFEQQQYVEAKKVLLEIDPAQLPEDQRNQLTELIKNTDLALSKASNSNATFDAAQAAMDSDKLAQSARLFQTVTEDATASADLKEKAKIQLALVKEKQAAKAPAMRELLKDAQGLYDAGKLDESQNAVNTIKAVGADLGWQDNAKPDALERKIAEKRVAMAKAAAAPSVVVAAPAPETPAAAPVAAPSAPGVEIAPAAPAPVAAPSVTVAPAGTGLLTETIDADAIQREKALTHYNIALKNSTDEAAKNNFASAIENARLAISIIDTSRQYFSESEANSLRDSAQKQMQLASDNKAVWDAAQKTKAERDAALADAARAAMREKTRAQRVDRLFSDAHAFIKNQQYKEAADTLRQLLLIDPNNSSAKLSLALIGDRINYREFDRLVQKEAAENVRQMLISRDQLIPYADLLVYPEDWIELTRTRVGDTSSQESPANRLVRDRLEENVKEISAENQGFEKVVNFLRDNTNTNIFVNWKTLESAGIDRNTQVSVNLREVPFRKALTTILSEVGGGTANLGYTIDDGVITITTREELNSPKYTVIRVYDIRDMLVQPDNNIKPPDFNLSDVTKNGSTSGGSGGGGGNASGNLFSDTAGGSAGSATKSRDDIVKDIKDTIQSIVATDSWRDKGGFASISELNGQLIINQTVDNQFAVYNLLAQLRETRALQIAIEARILLLDTNFLDDFGLGWQLGISPGFFGMVPGMGQLNIGNNNLNGASSITGAVPSSGVPSTLAGLLGTGGTAGGGNPDALAISGSGGVLNSWNLNLLLRATQADRRTITVTSPRVTLFNGQRGYIAVTQQTNFVSNFNQTSTGGSNAIGVPSNPSIATNLTVSTLTTGVVLYVEATVSADRRYVVMKVHPQLSHLDRLDTFDVFGFNPLDVIGSTLVGGGFVQLPTISYTTVDTMVSVPDGGTLMLGGQKIVGEAEIEVGVPVLSKIPGINRLFTNRSMTKDERTLLILVRPKIIVQKEEETRLFGPNYDRASGVNSGIPNNLGTAGVGINEGTQAPGIGIPKN